MVGDILQPTHLIFVLVVALLVLGPKRLPEVGRQLGNGLRDFRAAINGERSEPDEAPPYEEHDLAAAPSETGGEHEFAHTPSATAVEEHEFARQPGTVSAGTQLTLGDERAPRTGSAPADPAPTRDRAEALLDRAEAQIRDWQREGLQLVTVLDARYPQNLRTVWDRPPLLFVAGTLRPEDARSVAVVGARRATGAGVATAARLAEHLVGSGYAVVSGLASGIDAAAHQAALEAGGRTMAVVGTGLRHCYPAENAALQRRI